MQPYDQLLKFGRALADHGQASEFAKTHPAEVLAMVDFAEKEIRWTKVEDFFSLFPPIKRYEDDGTWDFHSTNEMIREDLGTAFGKDDLKMLLMTRCYENKFIHLVGFAFMIAVSELNEQMTGRTVIEELINK